MIQLNTMYSLRKGIYLVLLLMVFNSTYLFSQTKKGDRMYEKFEYEKALVAYEKEYNDSGANPYLTRRIAMTYRNLGEIETSALWFKRTLDKDQSNPKDFLYYAEALKFLQEYEQAIEYYEKYASKVQNDSRAGRHLRNKEYYKDLLNNKEFTVKKLKMSDENAQFGVTKYKNGKYFFSTTGSPNPEMSQNYNMFESNPYLDIFIADQGKDYEFSNIEKLKGGVNSKYHDGPIAYDKTHKELYVTRNNMKGGSPQKDENGRVNLKIFVFSESEEGEWINGRELKINNDDYSVAHPSISPDGSTLYVSSNKPGGYGNADIYYCKRNTDGTWGNMVNMGAIINTEGDESFPFMTTEVLYFSSDGHAGLGGLDIFRTYKKEGEWVDPINLASPINSYNDDISFMMNEEDNQGYFSSNRSPDHFGDDIYYFTYSPTVRVKTVVVDKYTLKPIEGVIVKLYDESGFEVMSVNSDEEGKVDFTVEDVKCNYVIKIGDGNEWKIIEKDINFCLEVSNLIDLNLSMMGDSGVMFEENVINFINKSVLYFNYNEAILTDEAKAVLDRIIDILSDNPELRVQIDGYTDSRGSDKYNKVLSEMRANSTLNYLVDGGIRPTNLVPKYHGKSNLIQDSHDCSGSTCDSKVHQLNRRITFTVLNP